MGTVSDEAIIEALEGGIAQKVYHNCTTSRVGLQSIVEFRTNNLGDTVAFCRNCGDWIDLESIMTETSLPPLVAHSRTIKP